MRPLRNAVLVVIDAVLITVFVLAVHWIWLRNTASALLRGGIQGARYSMVWAATKDTWSGLTRIRGINLDGTA